MEVKDVRTLSDLVQMAAERQPDKVYLKEKAGKEIAERTYGDLYDHSRRIASFLRKKGEKPVHCAVIGPTSIPYIECLFGIWIAGDVTVPIDPLLPGEEIIDNLVRADVTVFFHDARFAPLAETLNRVCPQIETVCLTEGAALSVPAIIGQEEPAEITAIDPAQCACILYTSGTTGKSKGACCHTQISLTM